MKRIYTIRRSNSGNPFGGGRTAGAATTVNGSNRPAGGAPAGAAPAGGAPAGSGSGFGGAGSAAGRSNSNMFASDDIKVAEYLLKKWEITE